jgi:hypothetical protein
VSLKTKISFKWINVYIKSFSLKQFFLRNTVYINVSRVQYMTWNSEERRMEPLFRRLVTKYPRLRKRERHLFKWTRREVASQGMRCSFVKTIPWLKCRTAIKALLHCFNFFNLWVSHVHLHPNPFLLMSRVSNLLL